MQLNIDSEANGQIHTTDNCILTDELRASTLKELESLSLMLRIKNCQLGLRRFTTIQTGVGTEDN